MRDLRMRTCACALVRTYTYKYTVHSRAFMFFISLISNQKFFFFLLSPESKSIRYRYFFSLIFGSPGIAGWRSERQFVFLQIELPPYLIFDS